MANYPPSLPRQTLLLIFWMIHVLCWEGHQHWNTLYSADGIVYEKWNGFWNGDNGDATGYQQIVGVKMCQTDCNCLSKVLSCSGGLKTVFVRKQTAAIDNLAEIGENSFPTTVEEIELQETKINYIHPKAFRLLTKLRSLTIIKSNIYEIPDLSECASLRTLNLFSNQIQIFSHNATKLPASLETLNLISNKIRTLPTGWLSNLPRLKYISFSNNQLKYIPGRGFGSLPGLEYVGLDGNFIASVNGIELNTLATTLRHLNLSNNFINYIETKALRKMEKLRILDLHNNSIADIPDKVFWDIPRLLHLDLIGNRIKQLKYRAFEQLPELKTLRLDYQQDRFKLEVIFFDSLWNLTSLRSLFLGFNALTRFPHPVLSESSTALPNPWINLAYLDLANNDIASLVDYSVEDFPQSAQVYYLSRKDSFEPFKKTPMLLYLNLINNRISEIKERDLEHCKALYFLFLDGNYLSDQSIHPNAFQNTTISDLWLASQKGIPGIQYVPRAVTDPTKMKALKLLKLQSNSITYILKGTFTQLVLLHSLDLSYNKIIDIEDGAFPNSMKKLSIGSNRFFFKNRNQFNGLENLAYLDLSNNMITVLPDTAFHGMKGLEELYLGGNRIGRLMKVHFRDLKILKQIGLPNNNIAYIEDGTFASCPVINLINLENNKLSRIPMTDFWNIKIAFINLKQNLIAKVQTNAFVNITFCQSISLHNNRIERVESYGFNDVSCTKIDIGGISNGNKLKIIESNAFHEISSDDRLDLSWVSVKMIPKYAFKFKKYPGILYLNNGLVTSIESYAFDFGLNEVNIELHSCSIEQISNFIFAPGSKIRALNLENNKIRTIHDNAFTGAVMSGAMSLKNNALKVFPKALEAFPNFTSLDLSYNQISDFPPDALEKFTQLTTLNVDNNMLTRLRTGLLKKQSRITDLYARFNQISRIDDDAFVFETASPAFMRLHLQGNPLKQFPRLTQNLTSFRFMALDNLETFSPRFLDRLPLLWIMQLTTSSLECDCELYSSLASYFGRSFLLNEGVILPAPKCRSPLSLNGRELLKSRFSALPKADFICNPINIRVSAPKDYTIQIDYDVPVFSDASQSSRINMSTDTVNFTARCQTEGEAVISAHVVNKNQIVISGESVIKPGREYGCAMTMNWRGKQASLTSRYFGFSRERREKASQCKTGAKYECTFLEVNQTLCLSGCDVEASNANQLGACDDRGCCKYCYTNCDRCNDTRATETFELDIKYYDFKFSHPAFDNIREYKEDPRFKDPEYIRSPFESYLKIPSVDGIVDEYSFAEWYREDTGKAFAVPTKLTLASKGEKDPYNGKNIFKYWSSRYWPVNGLGYQAESQRDCAGVELVNLGFTSAIRTGFTYNGDEHIAVAGGEELWVYVDKVRVISLFHDPADSIRNYPSPAKVPCKSVKLRNASGEAFIIPSVGEVDIASEKCVNLTELPEERVNLTLQVGGNYRLEIFHAERFRCSSEFLFWTSSVYFLSAAAMAGSKPVIDYVARPSENIHIRAILTDILLKDDFSTGPFRVTVNSGNEENVFEIKPYDNKTRSEGQALPPPRVYQNVTLHGEPIILCSNDSGAVTSIYIDLSPARKEFVVDYPYAALTVKNHLDFEKTSEYLLRLTVSDTSTSRKGDVVIKVAVQDESDNCPMLPDKCFVFSPLPPLQETPLLVLNATDLDSGENGRITYIVSEIISKVPTLIHKTFNISGSLVTYAETVEWTVAVNVFAVDNGVPRRGDFVQVNITYRRSCDEAAKVVVGAASGQVFFRAPKMTLLKRKDGSTPTDCFQCTAGYYCMGDGTELPCNVTGQKYWYSFGMSDRCLPCPEGWLCHDGVIRACNDHEWVKCNDTWCPETCFKCPYGAYCKNGKKYDCRAGQYSDGLGPCRLCAPGSFSNTSMARMCTCCPAGYESTSTKDGCQLCQQGEYSTASCNLCQSCNFRGTCPCEKNPCYPGVKCHNIGLNSSLCLGCPDGLTGDGITCNDIDECTVNPCFKSCINLKPGYRCSGCPAGYEGTAPSGVGMEQAKKSNQTCRDIDECATGKNLCDPNSLCINSPGSYRCGRCADGFLGDGYLGCRPGNFCIQGSNDCDEHAQCTSLGSGKFICTCLEGFTGTGQVCGIDEDYDGVASGGASCVIDACKPDNCAGTPNGGQEDFDDDTKGDVCDDDDDGDNIPDLLDNCPFSAGAQTDSDGDGVGDACDNCRTLPNTDQLNADGDELGDVCDKDMDGDGIDNARDNCPLVPNNQADEDADGIGDACDNCLRMKSMDQSDRDQNGYGDVCDGPGKDLDGDGILNVYDNCPDLPNADQLDTDRDGAGDACDDDEDGDGVGDVGDNCVLVKNADQNHLKLNYDVYSKPVGDACVDDFDGDGSRDGVDLCPNMGSVSTTSFSNPTLVDLSGSSSSEPGPRWRITNKGRDVEQLQRTLRPVMLIGRQRYGEVDYSGVMFVNDNEGIDYMGIVFGYQSNRKFYLVMWRHKNVNLYNDTYKAGVKGIQIKFVNSILGPRKELLESIWHSNDQENDTTLLWQDPEMKGWEHRTPYIFHVEFRPSLGRIRLLILRGQTVLTDSGYIYNTAITGGRLGVFGQGQPNLIFSNLKAKCLESDNRALYFDGINSYVKLPSIDDLQLTESFTLSAWVRLASPVDARMYPIVCDLGQELCLFVQDGVLQGSIGTYRIKGRKRLDPGMWSHASVRLDGQDYQIELFLNGISEAKIIVAEPTYRWSSSTSLYLGRDASNFFIGSIDEVVIYNVHLSDDSLKSNLRLAGLVWPIHQRLVSAYYPMDQAPGDSLLDQSGNGNNGVIHGALWVQSLMMTGRFRLSYPNN